MALEFALRPRISLERPPPRRRSRKLRVPPLVFPIAAYWLGIGGVTHVLLRSTAAESAESRETSESGVTDTAAEPAEEFDDSSPSAPPSPATPPGPRAAPQLALVDPEPAPSFEPTPAPAPAFEPEPARPPPRERAPEPKAEPNARVAVREQAPKPEPRRLAPALPETKERSAALALAREPAPAPRELRNPADDVPPPREVSAANSLPSCESAAAAANETLDLRAARGAPDLTRDAFASVLENGAYLARCSIPASTALDICAAVQDGRVVGVSVTAVPRSAAVSSCVRRAVASLRFPRNARLDVTRTRFEAAR